jgi:hypothetical protein
MHTPQSLADVLERDYFPMPSGSTKPSAKRYGAKLYLAEHEWRMVIAALRASPPEAEGPPADLVARCREVLNWKRSGVLHGDALRRLAASEWRHKDERNELRLAETQTADEAMEMIVLLSRSPSESAK